MKNMKIDFRMVDTKKKLNNTIKKAFENSNSNSEFVSLTSEMFRVQQFYTWNCFMLLVEDSTGCTF